MDSDSGEQTSDVDIGEQTFNIFDFFYDFGYGIRFKIFYDPGDHGGQEVYSFQGSAREIINDEVLEINYTFQEETYYSHDVCYGVMGLNVETKEVLYYSLHDKYDNEFTPSDDYIVDIFNGGDPQHLIWSAWYDEQEPDHEYYDRAAWIRPRQAAGVDESSKLGG